MDFRVNGTWLYYMEGPDGTRHYCRADYKSIVPNKSYEWMDAFCDEKGNISTEMPRMNWKVVFNKAGTGTKVDTEISFDNIEDLEKIIEMASRKDLLLHITILMNCWRNKLIP